jgi:hypothetical protein
MRAFIVLIALIVSVVFLVAFLVFGAGFAANIGVILSLFIGLSMMAVLFASISAIGPKFQATPLLTPIMAGINAAAFAAILVIAGDHKLSQPQPPASHLVAPADDLEIAPSQSPAVTSAPIAPIAPEPETRAVRQVDPEPTLPPQPSATIDASDDNAPTAPDAPVIAPDIATAPPDGPPDAPAADAPMVLIAPPPSTTTAPTDDNAANATDALVIAPDEPLAPVARSPSALAPVDNTDTAAPDGPLVLVPPVAPATATDEETTATEPLALGPSAPGEPGEPLSFSLDSFDISSPETISNTPAAPSPPIPRSRPCGADGPPCP